MAKESIIESKLKEFKVKIKFDRDVVNITANNDLIQSLKDRQKVLEEHLDELIDIVIDGLK